jgi:hypothetical protein
MNSVIGVMRVTAAVVIVAMVAILALGIAVDWALAVVLAIMVTGLAVLVVPLESILYDERQPRGHHHG